MTSQNFAYWLAGFMTNKESLTKDEVTLINANLESIVKEPMYTAPIITTGNWTPHYQGPTTVYNPLNGNK